MCVVVIVIGVVGVVVSVRVYQDKKCFDKRWAHRIYLKPVTCTF